MTPSFRRRPESRQVSRHKCEGGGKRHVSRFQLSLKRRRGGRRPNLSPRSVPGTFDNLCPSIYLEAFQQLGAVVRQAHHERTKPAHPELKKPAHHERTKPAHHERTKPAHHELKNPLILRLSKDRMCPLRSCCMKHLVSGSEVPLCEGYLYSWRYYSRWFYWPAAAGPHRSLETKRTIPRPP